MLSEERQTAILKLLEEKQFLKLADLLSFLGVSEATIRRDLNYLEKKQKLLRVHGGAKLYSPPVLEEEMERKKEKYFLEKKKVVEKAKDYLSDNQSIFIDAGTTTELLIPYLAEKKNIKVITNGYSHIPLLLEQGIPSYLISGKIKKKTQALVGAQAVLSLENFHFDLAFLGANVYDENFCYTPDEEEAIVKQCVGRKAREVYVLADSSKKRKYEEKEYLGVAFLKRKEVILVTESEEKDDLYTDIKSCD